MVLEEEEEEEEVKKKWVFIWKEKKTKEKLMLNSGKKWDWTKWGIYNILECKILVINEAKVLIIWK